MLNRFFALISITLLTCVGCTCSPKNTPPPPETKQSLTPEVGSTVNLAIWSNYIPPALVMEFEQQHKVKVEITNFASNEELLAKLQAGATGYDVIVPSDYMIEIMSKLGLLETLDHARIPNLQNVDPRFKGKEYDPQNATSVPYGWIVTGVAVNRNIYKGEVKSWTDLLANPKVHGRISLLDDVREVLGAALKLNGHSLNSTSADDLFKAKQTIAKIRPHIKAFTSDAIPGITSGDVAMAQMYSSDALQAGRNTEGKVAFFMPSEGGTLAIDNLSIPKGAQNVAGAYTLINYLLSESSSLAVSQNILVGPVVQGVGEKLPAELQKIPALFPDPKILAKYEMMRDLGDATTLYDKIWTELKAGAE